MAKELAKQYDPKGTEDRIYQEWCDKGYFHTQIDRSKKPFTIVMPPPNVTGSLHMGHAFQQTIMDTMIRFYADYKETLEKQSMGFQMSSWDRKLLKYGRRFETEMMDLSVNIPLESALDLGWKILADCFDPTETGIKTDLINEYWPKQAQ